MDILSHVGQGGNGTWGASSAETRETKPDGVNQGTGEEYKRRERQACEANMHK